MIYNFLFLVSVAVILVAGFLAYLESFKSLLAKIKRNSEILLNSISQEEISLLIDIGSGSIGVALASFQKRRLPKIFYGSRSSFTVVEKPDASNLREGVKTILNELLSKMMKYRDETKTAALRMTTILITFSSPWFVSKMKGIHFLEDNSFSITQSMIMSCPSFIPLKTLFSLFTFCIQRKKV